VNVDTPTIRRLLAILALVIAVAGYVLPGAQPATTVAIVLLAIALLI
jgi:hypothetical protein